MTAKPSTASELREGAEAIAGEAMRRNLKPNIEAPGSRRLRNAPVAERVMFRSVAVESGCWLWLGGRIATGYGLIRSDMGGRVVLVHRAVYEAVHGPIPPGLEIDHLCHVRNCVNPDHLEAVTHQVNVQRKRPQETCKRGHALSLAAPDSTGRRSCRECQRIRAAERRRGER